MNGRMRGFTLTEALAAMAIAVVALGIALPSFSQMLNRHQELAATNEMLAQLALARTWAISRGQPVALCPSIDRQQCHPAVEWGGNWIIYADPDGNRQPDASSDVLTLSPAPGGDRLRILSSAGRTQLRYLPSGRAAGSNLTLRLCSNQAVAAEVIVSATGRARSARLADRPACAQ
ncbi:GspH/FimT family pseudopilin [Xanthomonas sp. 1678]|uniref:GspH/FimT family pseudopilin n=1 Tax=Xanthomonas sp. 1678 TaxID=3158788 RepID=UPI00285D18A3|nr:type IV fimbrial biogenesis protein FimT [Xanthomonas translucens]